MRKVVVSPYNVHWPSMYDEEAGKLRTIFGEQLVAMHHIGSTSVPGLEAKPIIDILVVVQDIARVDAINHEMQAFGYEVKGEYGIPGRRFFRKAGMSGLTTFTSSRRTVLTLNGIWLFGTI